MAARQTGLPLVFKKAFDRSVAAMGLVVTAPVIGVAVAAVRATVGRPAFFSQVRPGLHGKPFRVYKLRTMTDERGTDGRLLPDAERLTPVGRFLRATSIDELPQLWNVLRGELSLVGPRPLLMEYLSRYSPTQARRHEVLPGITGWAQIHGRNAVDWPRRFELDVWYVDNWSLALDAKILLATFRRVLARDGIAQEGHVTMPNFMGNERVDAVG